MKRREFIALATGLVAAPGLVCAAGDTIKLRDLYNKDLSFSDLAQSHEGKRITVSGFMAPPLKAESAFFVLTKTPMAVCPFCETDAEWPDDILAIYTKRTVRVVPFNIRIETTGVLELGTFKDEETGFVSRVRLSDAIYS
ncbi:hypothetical protein [Actibacterium sp. D379-3]